MPNSKLNLIRRIMMAVGADLTIGTCPVCHCLVDLDAEGPHRWWHEQQAKEQAVQVPTQSHDTRPIRVGRHMK